MAFGGRKGGATVEASAFLGAGHRWFLGVGVSARFDLGVISIAMIFLTFAREVYRCKECSTLLIEIV